MENVPDIPKVSPPGKTLFVITGIAAIFWVLTRLVNVYKIKFVGAIVEMLWLPAVLILFVLPLISFILWAGGKFSLKSYHFFSMLVAVAAILTTYFLKK